MAYYLGFDAGGTKTECAIANGEVVLARSTGGAIKRMRVSEQDAQLHLDQILESITERSGIRLDSIACVCVGLAGIEVPSISAWVRTALQRYVHCEILFCGDQEAALDAAFSGGSGVLVVAGTGTNFIARTSKGQLIRVGGWGPAVGDEGSGMWIGKQAVRAVFDSIDRASSTALWEAIRNAWDLSDISGLMDVANREPAPNFAALAPLVVACAAQGDRYAQRVLQDAGEHLGQYAGLVLDRWWEAEPAPLSLPRLAYTGGILRNIAPVREAMCSTILYRHPDVRIEAQSVDAVLGALWRARTHHVAGRVAVDSNANA